MHAGSRADAGDEAIHLRLIPFPLEHCDRHAKRRHRIGEPLPISAVAGEDDHSAPALEQLEDRLETFAHSGSVAPGDVEVRQPDDLHQRFSEMMEHAADGGAPTMFTPLRKRGPDVAQRDATMTAG